MERIPVEPSVLQWARESAGLHDLAIAAKKLSVSPASLQKWEEGSLKPTIKQLRATARVYKRPLAVLLLSEPPKDFDALRDFRRISASDAASKWSPSLEGEFRRAVSQREVYLELLDVAPRSVHASEPPLTIRDDTNPERAAEEIRSLLGMDSWPLSLWSRPRELLNQLTSAIENLGILVIHTRDVDISEMRGFSITEWPFPVIAVNGSDWHRPRIFTLLHELTHIFLQTGGLCDLHELPRGRPTQTDDVEQFCNEVAAATLMPTAAINSFPVVAQASKTYSWSLEELDALTRRFGASAEAVMIRLIKLGKADWPLYVERKKELDTLYEQARQQQKKRQREAKGGPSYYVVKARDLGHGYINSVLDAYQSRSISSLDVTDFLSVRYEQLTKLQEALRR